MTPSHLETLSTGQKRMEEPHAEAAASTWKPLSRTGGAAALTIVGIMVIQIIVFIASPPPGTVLGYFTLFHQNGLLGLLSLDLLYLVDNALVVLLYLALYAALRRASPSLMAIALALGLVGIAAYFASNTAFEMLSLSNQYAAATTAAQRVSVPGFRAGDAGDLPGHRFRRVLHPQRRCHTPHLGGHAAQRHLWESHCLRRNGGRRLDAHPVYSGNDRPVLRVRFSRAYCDLADPDCPQALPARAGRIERRDAQHDLNQWLPLVKSVCPGPFQR